MSTKVSQVSSDRVHTARLRRMALVTVGVLSSTLLVSLSGTSSAQAPTSLARTTNISTATFTGEVKPFPDLKTYMTQKLTWKKCDQDFQCSMLRVPLDYTDPGSRAITISLVRHLALDRKRRIGSLVVNPGGPGSSGAEYATYAPYIVMPQILNRFDIVGFDPRGVGKSTPLWCLTGPETDKFVAVDGSPSNEQQENDLINQSQNLARNCMERAGALLPFVGTLDAARDLDILRAVLGDKKLNMLGKSYGTLLAGTYAHLFPKNVGRFVLDGALDPTVALEEISNQQAKAFEDALHSYLASYIQGCKKLGKCLFGNTIDRAHDTILKLVTDADTVSLPSKSKRLVTQSEVVLGIISSLYDSEGGWKDLTSALTQAIRGDGTELLGLADYYVDRNPNGKYAINSNEISYAVNCLDKTERMSLESTRKNAAALSKISPIFGEYLAWSSFPCNYWPVPAKPLPLPLSASGSAPILVVGTSRDPATPVAWAVGLANQLGTGHLLVFNGDGHTAYDRGSTCIDNAIDAYLLTGTLPKTGLICN